MWLVERGLMDILRLFQLTLILAELIPLGDRTEACGLSGKPES
jgi:hypothetical protein